MTSDGFDQPSLVRRSNLRAMAKISSTQAQTVGDLYLNTQNKKPRAGSDADWTDVLAEVPLFADLSARHLRRLTKLAKIQRLAPFTQIVRKGERADTFFLILDGNAVVRPPGKRVVKLGPGDFFGELALLDDEPRSATVEAQDGSWWRASGAAPSLGCSTRNQRWRWSCCVRSLPACARARRRPSIEQMPLAHDDKACKRNPGTRAGLGPGKRRVVRCGASPRSSWTRARLSPPTFRLRQCDVWTVRPREPQWREVLRGMRCWPVRPR
jgi:Cyclic nucleotide-binding domain